MQYIVLFRRRTEDYSESQFAALLDAEVQAARQLYMQGVIRQIWHRGDMPGACLLIEAASKVEVEEKINTLPLVQKDMLETVMILPLKPWGGFAPDR